MKEYMNYSQVCSIYHQKKGTETMESVARWNGILFNCKDEMHDNEFDVINLWLQALSNPQNKLGVSERQMETINIMFNQLSLHKDNHNNILINKKAEEMVQYIVDNSLVDVGVHQLIMAKGYSKDFPKKGISVTRTKLGVVANGLTVSMTERLIDEVAENALNECVRSVQGAMGVEDGGFAGQYFAGHKALKSEIIQYIRAELAENLMSILEGE